MNINEVRSIIRKTIAEAMEEKKKEKKQAESKKRSSGKLLELKTELKNLEGMQNALGQFNLSEGGDGEFIAEFAHMEKYVNEFNKLKDAHARLSEMIGNQSSLVKQKIEEETRKIKEMIGLEAPAEAPKPTVKKPAAKKDEPKKDEPKKDEKKPAAKKPAAKKDK